MTNEQLFELLAKSLAYTAIVYKQSTYTTNQNNFDNVFVLEFKHEEIPDDSLLFFVPSVSSNNSGDCKLKIKVPYIPTGSNSYSYKEKTYTIVKETNNGVAAPAGEGDIIANRMCIFRFRSKSTNIVLVNSPLTNSATLNDLKVTNCQFINKPTVANPDNPSLPFILVTSDELNALTKRIEDLENKIIFGTEDPEDALSDKPTGTIYVQVDKD